MNLVTGLAIPFLGTTLGSAMVFFNEKQDKLKSRKITIRFCIRSNDCSFNMVFNYTIN